MRSILSLISKLENCSTESTPLFGYVGVTPPPQGVISSSIATSEDSFRTTKSERALQANQKIVRIVCKILLAVFKAKVEWLQVSLETLHPVGWLLLLQKWPKSGLLLKSTLIFFQMWPKNGQKGYAIKKKNIFLSPNWQKDCPLHNKVFFLLKKAGEYSFGSFLTQTIHTSVLICERKSRNYDFIHEKEYKISLEIIFLDRERVTHFPKYPLENMNIDLVFWYCLWLCPKYRKHCSWT